MATALLRKGTIVFDELGHSVKEIEFLTDPTAGEVRIASLESLNSSFLPAVIDRLSRKFPRLTFDVLSIPAPTTQHLEVLHERTVDLAVIHLTPPFEHDDLTAEFSVFRRNDGCGGPGQQMGTTAQNRACRACR
jgi:DNA-binding transcriptional LysR family regulator